MSSAVKPPPFDAELARVADPPLDSPVIVTPQMIPMLKAMPSNSPHDVVAGRPIRYSELTVPAAHGVPDITLGVFERTDRARGGPAVYYIHGGGLILGDRCFGLGPVIDWVTELDAILVSVEYRLAPEHPFPAPFQDCYAGLEWLAECQAELGYDPEQLVLAGVSAGGGLAAAVALKARDVAGPKLAAQVLSYPMLDDRNDTVSSHQFDGLGRWDKSSNETGWDAYLGELRGTSAVPPYAAPARAEELSGLPPTYIDVGSAEVFRDEDVTYAGRIWAAGGDCELHVWPGGFHAFDIHAPDAALSVAMMRTRTAWLARTLGP